MVDGLDDVPMEDRDTKGDVYEYMLGKIATAGQNGQFRITRQIIQLMVEMVAPTLTDSVVVRPPPAPGRAAPRARRVDGARRRRHERRRPRGRRSPRCRSTRT